MQHPDIDRIERDGYPYEDKGPVCEICGRECSEFFFNKWGDFVGCDECVKIVDAWEEVSDV